MAFDLNKNNGTNPPVQENARTKFDLTKQESPVAGKPPKQWISVVVVALLIGGGLWYFVSAGDGTATAQQALAPEKATDSAAQQSSITAVAPTGDLAAADKQQQSKSDTTVVNAKKSGSVATAGLQGKIPVKFKQGSAAIVGANKALLAEITGHLAQNPSAALHIYGYASSDGNLAFNKWIAQKRANAFKRYLVSKNIKAGRMIAEGKGIENPIAANHTNAGREMNRRVEIAFQ